MSQELSNVRLLVLEDEVLIRLDLEDALALAGARDIILVETIARARAHLAAGAPPHVALLDILVNDGRTFDLARELLGIGAKVIFVTGYRQGVAEDLVDCPVVEKPFTPQDLIAAILGVISSDREPPASGRR
jgi:DNA-binding NtrC family response regulator